jgi:hypothetical protein
MRPFPFAAAPTGVMLNGNSPCSRKLAAAPRASSASMIPDSVFPALSLLRKRRLP